MTELPRTQESWPGPQGPAPGGAAHDLASGHSLDPLRRFVLQPRMVGSRELQEVNRVRRDAGRPPLHSYDVELLEMAAPQPSSLPQQVRAWLQHPDERVLVECLSRFPAIIGQQGWWESIFAWSVANLATRDRVWTWVLDRVWHIVSQHAPGVLRRWSQGADATLRAQLGHVDLHVTARLLDAYVSAPVWDGIARSCPDVVFMRAVGMMRRFECWVGLLDNVHVTDAMRRDIASRAWQSLVTAGTDVVDAPTPPDAMRRRERELEVALDVLERSPHFVAGRSPVELLHALRGANPRIQSRVAALTTQGNATA